MATFRAVVLGASLILACQNGPVYTEEQVADLLDEARVEARSETKSSCSVEQVFDILEQIEATSDEAARSVKLLDDDEPIGFASSNSLVRRLEEINSLAQEGSDKIGWCR